MMTWHLQEDGTLVEGGYTRFGNGGTLGYAVSRRRAIPPFVRHGVFFFPPKKRKIKFQGVLRRLPRLPQSKLNIKYPLAFFIQ